MINMSMITMKSCDTVLLDMDGTLLDLNFDNHFWLEFVPLRYAQKHRLSLEQAKQQLQPRFKAMEGKLEWYCLDYWTQVLQLDIVGLKTEIAGLITPLPHVLEFLTALKASQRQVLLVTNAHRASLQLKMEKTCLQPFFDAIVCAHDFGLAKEQQGFWQALQSAYPFDKQRALLVDDSLPVLKSARQFGIAQCVAVSQPDSQQPIREVCDYPAIVDFRQLIDCL
jgi:HAD superfamily hydrolase (TIGR01509 family)